MGGGMTTLSTTDTTGLEVLTDRGLLQVAGPDARSFLQGLITNDIERVGDDQAIHAGLLTPQGKILFDMLVVKSPEGFLIDCAGTQAAALLQRLSMYKLRARVSLTHRDDLAVSVSPEALTGGFPDPRTPLIGWRSIGPTAGGEAEGYDAARIALGLADSEADLGSGEFFPHEANLDQLGGVNFKKGCYVGQEVVSRMEHRGTARSRILPVVLEGDAPPKGTEIRAGEKQVGTLLSSQGNTALALIRLDRLAEAEAPLLAAGVGLGVRKPSWATYDVPGAA